MKNINLQFIIEDCICKRCGIPFVVKLINNNNKLILSCPNHLHNNFMKQLSPTDCDKIPSKINCKCLQCNKLRNNQNETFCYCYNCRQIICYQCFPLHQNQHPNVTNAIVNYDGIQNKCLNHINSEYKIFCFNCNDFLCEYCY